MTDKYTPAKGDYITLQGKKYLPARRRVQWFRGDHPDWTITTSIVELDWADGHVVIRADVLNEESRLISSGMKSETRKGFADFVEKAETGAIARAVAIAGYGTEDALDLDEGERIADSPVSPRSASPDPVGTDMRARLLEVAKVKGIDHAGLERYATEIGIPKGARATPEQLVALIVRIEGIETPSSDVGQSDTATVQGSVDEAGPPSGTSSDPAPAPTFDDVLRVSGGEEVPPKAGTPEYQALEATERAAARAYWQQQKVTA